MEATKAMIGAADLYGLSTLKSQTRWHAPTERRDVLEFDMFEIRRYASPPYNHEGTVVVAMAWLTFYAIAVIYGFIAS